MDTTPIGLYFLSMRYFDGIEFTLWDDIADYALFIDRRFYGEYALQFHHSGRFVHAFDQRRRETTDGPCAWLMGPGHRYRYGAPQGESRHHLFVHVVGPRIRHLIAGELLDLPPQPVRLTEPERFHATFRQLCEFIGPGRRYSSLVRHYRRQDAATFQQIAGVSNADAAVNAFESLLLQITQQPKDPFVPLLDRRLSKLAREIQERPTEDWNPEAEARKLCLSMTHFRRRFRAVNRMPLGRLVRDSRLAWAAWQLRDTDVSIKNIAAEVRATDVYYFTRAFARHYHTPPAHYRRMFRVA